MNTSFSTMPRFELKKTFGNFNTFNYYNYLEHFKYPHKILIYFYLKKIVYSFVVVI